MQSFPTFILVWVIIKRVYLQSAINSIFSIIQISDSKPQQMFVNVFMFPLIVEDKIFHLQVHALTLSIQKYKFSKPADIFKCLRKIYISDCSQFNKYHMLHPN